MQSIHRGDIYYADLDPIIGSEQGGMRPVLVLQNNTGNHYSPTVIISAITTRGRNHLPTHAVLRACPFLEGPSVVLLEQLRTVDKRRLTKYVATLDESMMLRVDRALAVSVGLR